ncbi:DUF262 domain-containing protein [Mycolicibacterium fortuitum]|uniref:GmrSD restriction endonucleases N-terminal domain-containing protein n=1 Tax=Mycolicibacterium fortuitum TaxID=1766 RepID=A0ABD6QQT8_MYCFO|nr:DUF262 domain-containing protein [Mycolicibacterium fortuitum]MCA4755024.1 DUF262 domain-containing protein [Mycolicibacterium fortuitum]OMC48940.1 hypothetical protein A5742_21500 [Mycolicibacterium fortuitum]WAY17134.1 DUF262 domain-containing protein [Mycolicibacterium fortuitum]
MEAQLKLGKSDPDLETIVSRIKGKELDLQPSFQRGDVWDAKRRQRLIDTILRGWYVPAVHLVIDTEGHELVLDGQQRLTTIRDFFDDELKIDGKIQPSDSHIEELDGLYYSQLPDNIRRNVNRFTIQTITLTDYRPQEPNELFFRLNQSYNLTPPEKRNALHGPARDQIKDLVEQLKSNGLLRPDRIGFANGRLAYDDIVARACVSVQIGNMRRHINNNVVEKFYRENQFSSDTIDSISDAGRELLLQIRACPEERVRFNKGTLQTWLIYCYWASLDSAIPPDLLWRFETERLMLKRGNTGGSARHGSPVTEILRIYDDRASYRVTDVTSVLARDLAIHLFSIENFRTRERDDSGHLLEILRETPSEMRQAEFFSFIENSSWGNPIASGRGLW